MGRNDHTPDKSQRTKRRGPRAVKEQLHWKSDFSEGITTLLEAVSEAGGYLGFGRNRTGDCLLLYVKLDDWDERVPIEDYDSVMSTLADLLAEL